MRTWLVLAIAACGSGDHAPDALVCSYGEPCNGTCVNLDTDSQNCGACGHACGLGAACWGTCDPAYTCLGIQTANPSATSGAYSDPLIRGHEMFCDMRTQPPVAYGDLVIVPATWSSPEQRLLTAVDLQDAVLQQAFLHFYDGLGAITPITTFDASDPCVADGSSGAWLTLGGSRVFMQYRGGIEAESTSFVASLAYRLVLPDAPSSPALDHLPGDFFTTNTAASAPSAACTSGTHAAFALNLVVD